MLSALQNCGKLSLLSSESLIQSTRKYRSCSRELGLFIKEAISIKSYFPI